MLADASEYLEKEQLTELRRVDAVRSLGSVAGTWGWIFACFALYVVYPSVLSVALAWLVMSGRHLALAILMHEGAHGLLLRNKVWNDRIGQWLTAYPTMTDMLLYRRAHFQHHRHTWTEQDPDVGLATALPVSPASFRRKIIRDLTGQTAYKRHRVYIRYAAGLSVHGKGLEGKSLWQAARAFASSQRGFLLTNAVILGGLTLAGRPEAYLLIWWLPAWTGYSVVLRLRPERSAAPDAHHARARLAALSARAPPRELPPRAPPVHDRPALQPAEGSPPAARRGRLGAGRGRTELRSRAATSDQRRGVSRGKPQKSVGSSSLPTPACSSTIATTSSGWFSTAS